MKYSILLLAFLTQLIATEQDPVIVQIDSVFSMEFPKHPITRTSHQIIKGIKSYQKEIICKLPNEEIRVLKTSNPSGPCALNREDLISIYKERTSIIRDSIKSDIKVNSFGSSLQNNLYLSDFYFNTQGHSYQCKTVQVKDTLYQFIIRSKSLYMANDYLSSLKVLNDYKESDQYAICDTTTSSINDQEYNDAYNSGYELGQMIAPFICLLVVIVIIGGLILFIRSIIKKKRRKEQEVFDQFDQ